VLKFARDKLEAAPADCRCADGPNGRIAVPLFYNLDGMKATRRKRIAKRLTALRDGLTNNTEYPESAVPPRNMSDTLLLATWNLQAFDGGDADNRTDESYWYIAEIVSHFDLVAIQEVGADLGGLDKLKNRDLSGLEKLKTRLGPTWDYVATDVTKGSKGNGERLAFLFDKRKVRFGGMAGEIVIPPRKDAAGKETIPARQLARTPSIVGFECGWFKFVISTVHIVFGKSEENDPERVAEVKAIAKFLEKRADSSGAWSANTILLGNFNIFSRDPDNQTYQNFESSGFTIPEALKTVPNSNVRTIARYYGQIALRNQAKNLEPTDRAGVFDYFDVVYTKDDYKSYEDDMLGKDGINNGKDVLSKNGKGKKRTPSQKESYYRNHWRRRQMSDHLPMWVEMRIDHGHAYLDARK
jgi:hypothetical protein